MTVVFRGSSDRKFTKIKHSIKWKTLHKTNHIYNFFTTSFISSNNVRSPILLRSERPSLHLKGEIVPFMINVITLDIIIYNIYFLLIFTYLLFSIDTKHRVFSFDPECAASVSLPWTAVLLKFQFWNKFQMTIKTS